MNIITSRSIVSLELYSRIVIWVFLWLLLLILVSLLVILLSRRYRALILLLRRDGRCSCAVADLDNTRPGLSLDRADNLQWSHHLMVEREDEVDDHLNVSQGNRVLIDCCHAFGLLDETKERAVCSLFHDNGLCGDNAVRCMTKDERVIHVVSIILPSNLEEFKCSIHPLN